MINEDKRQARRLASADLQKAANDALALLDQVTALRGRIEALERSRDFGDRATVALLKERLQHVYSDFVTARARSTSLAQELGYSGPR